MNKPNVSQIKEWLKSNVTQWFLERIALNLNGIDTVRNVDDVQTKEIIIARRLAIEIVESAFKDIYEAGELAKIQKKVAEEEDNIIKSLKDIRQEY